MKKLLFVPVLGALLASCGVVEVKLVPPTISNLQSQPKFCTNRDTLVDFRFDKGGLLTKLEVWVTKDDPNYDEPSDDPDAKQLGDVKFFDLGNNKVVSYIAADTDGSGKVQSLGADAQTIMITPTNQRLWVRGYNVDVASGFAKAANPITPSTDADCDLIFPYGDPNQ